MMHVFVPPLLTHSTNVFVVGGSATKHLRYRLIICIKWHSGTGKKNMENQMAQANHGESNLGEWHIKWRNMENDLAQ